MLTNWGRAITMRAGSFFRRGMAKTRRRTYAASTTSTASAEITTALAGESTRQRDGRGQGAEMIHVYLDGSFPTGHHEFADSVNNGPWKGVDRRVHSPKAIPPGQQNTRVF